jgi:hypothetical protein
MTGEMGERISFTSPFPWPYDKTGVRFKRHEMLFPCEFPDKTSPGFNGVKKSLIPNGRVRFFLT